MVAGKRPPKVESKKRPVRGDLLATQARLLPGTVVSVEAREGQTLNATYQTPNILRIADLSAMTVWTEVSEADVRRARRALDVLIGLGWAFPTRQVRRHVGTAGAEAFASEPAVRRINFGRLCEMTGTTWLLKRDRAHADRTKGDGLASLQQARQRRDTAPLPCGADSGGPPAARATPPPTGDPPRQPVARDTALRHINDILRALRS